MKIAIDFREGARPNRAGKGEYIYQLVRAWIKQYPTDSVMLVIEANQRVELNLPSTWRVVTLPAKGLWWQLLVVAWLEFLRPADLYFSATSLIAPAFVRSVKTVTTIADFTAWRFPATHLPRAGWIEKLCMPLALRFSNHLLAISEFTRQEAVDLFRARSEKITVTPLAVSDQFDSHPLPSESAGQVRAKYHLPEKFLLYLGTLEPRKNIARLVSAFISIHVKHPEISLVLAGAKGWRMDQLGDISNINVVTTGYIEDADRSAIYKLAEVFVFPSLYEGFGLPPLEAMVCGTPVITSATASLPEVVGEAEVLVDPMDESEIATAIDQVLSSSELRSQLRQQGLLQSQKFSWEKTVIVTRQAIHHYE